MALKAILDSIDGADEAVRGFYAEQSEGPLKGKFVLQVDGASGYALEDVSGLKSALGKERARADAAEKQAAAFGDIDPKKAAEALAKYEELSQLDPAKEADKLIEERVKAVREKMMAEFDKERAALQSENQSLKGEADQTARLRAKGEAFDTHGVMPERRKALDAYVDRYIKTDLREGKRVVLVTDDDGNPRIAGDGSNMNINSFVESLKNDPGFQWAFQGTDKTGGGTPPGKGGGTVNPQASKMSKSEKARALADGSINPADLAKA